MTCPLLVPPALLPFTVVQSDSLVVIALGRDACHHHGLAELSAIAWVRGIDVPLAIDLAEVQLLSSALIGWMFGLLHESRLRRLALYHASHRVQTQIAQVGLADFVSYQPTPDHQRSAPSGDLALVDSGPERLRRHELVRGGADLADGGQRT